MTPEQRSSGATPDVPCVQNDHNDSEGGTPMKVKNNTDAPWLRTNWRHVFLVTLHTIVLLLSAFSHDFRTPVLAPRALPQALELAQKETFLSSQVDCRGAI